MQGPPATLPGALHDPKTVQQIGGCDHSVIGAQPLPEACRQNACRIILSYRMRQVTIYVLVEQVEPCSTMTL
jgi:hypothetical protein